MAAADQGGGVRRGVALGGGHAPGRGGAHVQVHMPRCTCPGAHVRGLGGEIVRGGGGSAEVEHGAGGDGSLMGHISREPPS